ncbi:YcdB/YcdC domain-containing protein [Brevibacillus sp. 179-C9.3 HS]|uniref:YcdB/YcdC domain-containing protein n=1 Tax=unclassified Brevibacillus TaxID=2684853 RepID=UPI0039A07A21
MKPWIIRSSSFVLSASLLLPVAQAHAQSPAMSTTKIANTTAQADIVAQAAASNVKLSKEAALKLATKIVPTAGMMVQNVSFRSADTWRPFPEWSFSWVKKDADSGETLLSYSVGINANTGELTSYSRYAEDASSTPYAKRVSYEEAKKQAQLFFEKNNAEKAEETRLYSRDTPQPKTPLDSDFSYNFRFVRVVDGVLFPDNGADVSVDGSGTVTNYSLSWNDVKFEKAGSNLSQEEAEKLFKELAQPKPVYLLPYDRREVKKPQLGYMNPFTFYIDAETGEAMTQSLTPRKPAQKPVPVSSTSLSARHSGQALTQDGAVKSAEKALNLSNYELRSANYNERDYDGNRPVWDLEFAEKGKEKEGYAYVAIDAVTGDIYRFNKDFRIYKGQQKASKKPDIEKMKEKSSEYIRKWTPTTAHQLYWMDQSEEDKNNSDSDRTYLQFHRIVNGMEAASGSAHLTFDTETGELLSYSSVVGKEEYPAQAPKHLSGDEASDKWWTESEVEAIYALVPLSPEDTKRAEEQPSFIPKRSAKIVYRATATSYEQPYYLDAITGDWRSNVNGNVITLHRPAPADLKGHPAEKELLLMYEYDALSLENGNILPQKPITRGEMIEMLMISLNQGRNYPEYSMERKATYSDVANGSRYFSAVEGAVDRGLLDKNASKLNPNETITREELADMIVRALGYKKLTDFPDMFQSQFTDIANSKHRGSIVIATTLGIIPADKQKFQPQSLVPRADAAITFTRFLEKRGSQDPSTLLRK